MTMMMLKMMMTRVHLHLSEEHDIVMKKKIVMRVILMAMTMTFLFPYM